MSGAKWVGWLKTKPGAGEGVSASCAQRRVSAHEPQIWGQNSWQTWPPAGWAWGGAHKQAATKMRWFFTLQGPAALASAFYCKFLAAVLPIRIKLVRLHIICSNKRNSSNTFGRLPVLWWVIWESLKIEMEKCVLVSPGPSPPHPKKILVPNKNLKQKLPQLLLMGCIDIDVLYKAICYRAAKGLKCPPKNPLQWSDAQLNCKYMRHLPLNHYPQLISQLRDLCHNPDK